jgi:hypothetical protein
MRDELIAVETFETEEGPRVVQIMRSRKDHDAQAEIAWIV